MGLKQPMWTHFKGTGSGSTSPQNSGWSCTPVPLITWYYLQLVGRWCLDFNPKSHSKSFQARKPLKANLGQNAAPSRKSQKLQASSKRVLCLVLSEESTPQMKRYEPAWLAGTSVGDIMFQVLPGSQQRTGWTAWGLFISKDVDKSMKIHGE